MSNGLKLNMTDEHKAALAALAAAQQAVADARAKTVELERAVDEQRTAEGAAYRALHDAQMHADSFLPAVVIVSRSRHGAASRLKGVILRRTDKTITVKQLGNRDDTAQQFRPSRYCPGAWVEYPAPKGYSSTSRELEFTGQADA